MMSNMKSTGGGGDESKEKAIAKGLEIKEARDSIAEFLSKEECTKDCDESTLRVAQIFMAISNSMMAECGIIEEEKHSSLSYSTLKNMLMNFSLMEGRGSRNRWILHLPRGGFTI